MAIKKDVLNSLSLQERKQLTAVLENPLVWAESMFPAKWGNERYQDENGVWNNNHTIISGWETRPWQQKIIEAPGLRKAVRVNRRGGKSLMAIVKCLHTSFVKGKGVLVFTPYDKQCGELYKETHVRFMDVRPEIFTKKGDNPSIIVDTKSPYVIRFSNGGFINFITTGAKSGGKADSARGQGSNVGLLFLDEMDYMSDGELESIFSIAVQSRAMEIICTSTPTGKRGTFYDLCINTPDDWKAFHYTCWDTIPNWDEKQDRAMRALLNDSGYTHEMLAEFGEESEGVFNKESLDRAKERGAKPEYPALKISGEPVSTDFPLYGYMQSSPQRDVRKRRIVGVDWDKYGAGTQILIIETALNQRKPKEDVSGAGVLEDNFSWVKVIHRQEIPKSQFTLDNAVKTLVAINQSFNPDYYYLDAGYGEHQIEALQRMGMECEDPASPAYGIDKKIRRINFSHGVKVVDSYTKMQENRPIKPEMVGRLRNKFDMDEMILNPFDIALLTQLENYRVEKITASGQPKYVSVNEHIVDALMLAVWGLYVEYGFNPNQGAVLGEVSGPLGQRYVERIAKINAEMEKIGYRNKGIVGQEIDLVDRIEDDRLMNKDGFIPQEDFENNKDSAVTSLSSFDRDPTENIFTRASSSRFKGRRGF